MERLNSDDFQLIQTEKVGKHRLVEEDKLQEILDTFNLLKMGLFSKMDTSSIPFLMKYYRFLVHDFTYKELAQRTGMTSNQISGIEKGKIKPQPKTLKKLKEIFGEEFYKLALTAINK